MATSSPINWDFIVEKIKEEQCILVLGPGAYQAKGAPAVEEQLVAYLKEQKEDNIERYYEEDHFFLFNESYKRTLTCHSIKSFYGQLEPSPLLEKIAEIPFHIILTVTPDTLLPKIFRERYNYQFGYYKKNKDPQKISPPTKALPLIYNLFGCVENEESIVLTHNDLYDYFKSIFARKSMPAYLSTQLRSIKNIIFLGIPFNKWYMQLLLRELEIHNPSFEFIRYASNQETNKELETFCYEQFRINFSNNTINDFVNQLHDRIVKAGIVRKEGEEAESPTEKVRVLVREGELEEAIDALLECAEGTDNEEEVDILSSRYRRHQKKVLKGVLNHQDAQVEENKFIDTILQLVTLIEAA